MTMDRAELILLADLNYIEAMRDQTRGCEGTIIEEEGVCMMLGPAPHPVLNVLVRLDDRCSGDECVEQAMGLFEASRHGFTVILRNSVDDSDVREAAIAAGLVPLELTSVACCVTTAVTSLRNNTEHGELIAGGPSTEPAFAHVLVQATVPQ